MPEQTPLDILNQRIPSQAAETKPPDGKYWYINPVTGKVIEQPVSAEEMQQIVTAGYSKAVCKVGGAWVKPSVAGFSLPTTATVTIAPPPPPPPETDPEPAPAPSQTTVAVTSAPTPAPAPSQTAVAVAAAQPAESDLPTIIKDTSAADLVMAAVMDINSGKAPVCEDVAAQYRAVSSGFAPTHKFPTVSLKKEQWQPYVPKGESVNPILPVGNQPFVGVLLGVRHAAIGWRGAPPAAGDDALPPLWKYAIPTVHSLMLSPGMTFPPRNEEDKEKAPHIIHQEMVIDHLLCASNVQFENDDGRARFDEVGRMACETEFLFWRRVDKSEGFFLLLVPGYSAYEDMQESLETLSNAIGNAAYKVSLAINTRVNKRIIKIDPNSRKAKWTVASASLAAVDDPMHAAFKQCWGDPNMKVGMANMLANFHAAQDFNGMSLLEIAALHARYRPLLKRK